MLGDVCAREGGTSGGGVEGIRMAAVRRCLWGLRRPQMGQRGAAALIRPVWPPPQGRTIARGTGHDDHVNAVCYADGVGDVFYSGSDDGTIRVRCGERCRGLEGPGRWGGGALVTSPACPGTDCGGGASPTPRRADSLFLDLGSADHGLGTAPSSGGRAGGPHRGPDTSGQQGGCAPRQGQVLPALLLLPSLSSPWLWGGGKAVDCGCRGTAPHSATSFLVHARRRAGRRAVFDQQRQGPDHQAVGHAQGGGAGRARPSPPQRLPPVQLGLSLGRLPRAGQAHSAPTGRLAGDLPRPFRGAHAHPRVLEPGGVHGSALHLRRQRRRHRPHLGCGSGQGEGGCEGR